MAETTIPTPAVTVGQVGTVAVVSGLPIIHAPIDPAVDIFRRILIELRVMNFLLAQDVNLADDLERLRNDPMFQIEDNAPS